MSEVASYYAARADEYQTSVRYSQPASAAVIAPIRARYQIALAGLDVLEIACGPGYWTEAVARTARSIVAIDVNAQLVKIARTRLSSLSNVRCQVADAYTLDGISGPFTAAFAQFWWSHVPRAKLRSFLLTLHSRLAPGARVLFLDNLPYECHRRVDDAGDVLEERLLADGTRFEILKNCPTEREIRSLLTDRAEQILYRQFPEEDYWTLTYRTRLPSPTDG